MMSRPVIRAPVPGTAADDQDMRRMHKPQELNVSSAECAEEAYDRELIITSVYTVW
jgi:hypothetical protein